MVNGMKNLILFVSTLFIIGFLLNSCSRQNVIKKDIDDKISDIENELESLQSAIEENGGITSLGLGISSKRYIARDKAIIDAQGNLAERLETRVDRLKMHFETEVGSKDIEINEAFYKITKTVTQSILREARTEKVEYFFNAEDKKYVAYALMVISPKSINQLLLNEAKSQPLLYTQLIASESYKELEEETKKYEEWKKKQGIEDMIKETKFPWPPPKASTHTKMPINFSHNFHKQIYLKDILNLLEKAIYRAGYGEYSLYSVVDGFAMVLRLEQIYPDGKPMEYRHRWSIEVKASEIFNFESYIKSLFTASKGYFRVIVFIVTSQPFTQYQMSKIDFDEASEWASKGIGTLPPAIGDKEFSSDHYCVALIYEFEKITPDHDAIFINNSMLPAKIHLEKSNLWNALEN